MMKILMTTVAAIGLTLAGVALAAEGGHIANVQAEYADSQGGKLPTSVTPRYATLVGSAHVVLA